MRIQVENWSRERPLFFTAGNLPTQVAYGLTPEQVIDSFVVATLRRPKLLLAASFYFESPLTRLLVKKFPLTWSSAPPAALFFINVSYPSVLDHGLGKIEKSPSDFGPYSRADAVRARSGNLDRLGNLGVRNDVDISASIVQAWIASCRSTEPGSIGSIVRGPVDPDQIEATLAYCARIAEERRHDFIWPAIEPSIVGHQWLAKVAPELRRKHADLYVEITSLVLGAVETTPWLAAPTGMFTDRAVGDLGRFASVLRRIGLEPRRLHTEEALTAIAGLDELQLVRDIDDLVIETAVDVQGQAADEWRVVGLAEQSLATSTLTNRDIRRALNDACDAVGVSVQDQVLTRITKVERLYRGKFLRTFKARSEEILDNRIQSALSHSKTRKPVNPLDVLLFTSADPSIGAPMMKLAIDKEYKDVKASLLGLGEKCSLRIEYLPALAVADLQAAILLNAPKYFHFAGHGDSQGNIVMEGTVGPEPVNIRPVVRALSLSPTPVECAVFSSCYSLSAASFLEGQGVRYLVLWADKVGDLAARGFAEEFYRALAIGLPVPRAFVIGRNRLALIGRNPLAPRLFERVPSGDTSPGGGDTIDITPPLDSV